MRQASFVQILSVSLARPLGRQPADRAVHGWVIHELLILLVSCRPIDKSLNALVAVGCWRIAYQPLQMLSIRNPIMIAHDPKEESFAEIYSLLSQRIFSGS